ncbi:unnamed protein product [Fusarium graminearum]|uniref:C2H2-type domain-containing protein n=1 Tax=Gibberella zeae TaxID=5518 RepID=A0A9N8NM40_GIBZA|nr:unnamed protein product [Fusarium graminearum]
MATVQQVNQGLRTKANTDEEKPLPTFDPVAFDSIIYRQSRLRPPPGVHLSSRIVENGSVSRRSERAYLLVNPAIHKTHKRSQRWYKQKCEEIKRRPRRKAWFGKVQARLRWARAEKERLEQSRQNAQNDGTTPPFEPPEPRCFKQILDFGDVPEKELPEHVRNDPAWLKACAWLRKCEDQATHQRQVNKSKKEAQRDSAEGDTNHVNRSNRMEGIEHHDRESTNTPVNDTTTDDASEILTPHSSQSRVRPPQAVPSSATRHTTYEIISPSSEPYDPMNNYGSSESVRTPLGSEHAYALQQHRSYKRKQHKNTHKKEKTYECNYEGCNKRFTSSYKWKKHQKFHTGEMPYGCDINDCHRCFKTSSMLRRHEKIHNEEKTYECNHKGCNKRFTSGHEKIHNKEKTYECHHKGCNKSFNRPLYLRRHQEIHNEEKTYECNHKGCNKRFKTTYECKHEGCNKRFTSHDFSRSGENQPNHQP